MAIPFFQDLRRSLRMAHTKNTGISTGNILVLGVLLIGLWGNCMPRKNDTLEPTLFELMPSDSTGVTFENTVTESPIANIMTFQYFYNGGGVAVGDLNQDGLIDLYFTGNMVSNHLYLNIGNFNFRDVTLATNTAGREDGWATGAVMVDINQDGLLDIYVCYSGDYPEGQRKNQLFVNQGSDSQGIPEFREQAKDYGLDDAGYSTSAIFFDYDMDGDLDMLLLQHNPRLFSNLDENQYKKLLGEKSLDFHSKLYRNDAGYYNDVTEQVGLSLSPLSYGLGAGVSDLNGDGLPDIYIGNDYSAPDYLYINQGNGTFKDLAAESLGHTSLYSMGVDIADINNDGLPDVFTLDMLPEDSKRQKLLFSPENYDHFDLIERAGLHKQYMRNMLHLNNGNGVFSEIGQLAGVSNTDWSWAPLFADFDNDGHKDLLVTNGFLKDFTNLDFVNYREDYFQNNAVTQVGLVDLINRMPATPLHNYIFKNLGNTQFEDKTKAWGLGQLGNSNGASYADLDNDGDLDIIINNINGPAFIYRNNVDSGQSHIQIELQGESGNLAGYGSQVSLFADGKRQMVELQPYRGYQGNISQILHVGLGENPIIDSIIVTWPDGSQQKVLEGKPNSRLVVRKETRVKTEGKFNAIFPQWTKESLKDLPTHHTPFFRDFNRQGQLLESLSANGPILKVADITGDGIPELVATGLDGHQISSVSPYPPHPLTTIGKKALPTDIAIRDLLFFDMDNDGDLDLYIVAGGYRDFQESDPRLKDVLLVNDGMGNFAPMANGQFSPIPHSGAAAKAIDINGDGYLDLVIGGFYKPGRFPESDPGQILINQNGRGFKQIESGVLSLLSRVSAMETADLDGDGYPELIVASEWAPIRILCIRNGTLEDCSSTFLDTQEAGLWKSLLVDDLDGDGIPEILSGNHGLNSQYRAASEKPMSLYFADFDGNGSVDPILEMYMQGKPEVYLSRDELSRQLYRKKALFPIYGAYAEATLDQILNREELAKAEVLEVQTLETTLFKFQEGKFKKITLPIEAQFAPIYAITALEGQNQGPKDLLLAGNQWQARMKIGSISANQGVLLRHDQVTGTYRYIPQNQSGFNFQGDTRSLVFWQNKLWVGRTNLPITIYQQSPPKEIAGAGK